MVLSVQEAEAVRRFTTYLETNENFKDAIVTAVDRQIDVPLLLSTHERWVFEKIYDVVSGALANVSDDLYGEAVATEREQQRLESKDDSSNSQ